MKIEFESCEIHILNLDTCLRQMSLIKRHITHSYPTYKINNQINTFNDTFIHNLYKSGRKRGTA